MKTKVRGSTPLHRERFLWIYYVFFHPCIDIRKWTENVLSCVSFPWLSRVSFSWLNFISIPQIGNFIFGYFQIFRLRRSLFPMSSFDTWTEKQLLLELLSIDYFWLLHLLLECSRWHWFILCFQIIAVYFVSVSFDIVDCWFFFFVFCTLLI